MAADQKKLAILRWPARLDKAPVLIGAVLLSTLSLGCPAQLTGTRKPEHGAQEAQSRAFPAEAEPASVSSLGAGSAPIQLAAYHEPDNLSSNEQAANSGKMGANDHAKERGDEHEKITLPTAIELCVNNNFRVLAGAQRMRMAEGDLITSSLIPNTSLFADAQVIPLQRADILNQLGPPQYDALLSIPIDWLLFGKRVAAMKAARFGVEVSSADYADVFRVQLARTVDAFYEVLAAEEFLRLAKENHVELKKLEEITQGLAKAGKAGSVDLDRFKLAILEAFLEIHARDLALIAAKARLRPLIGRSASDPDFEVEGALGVKAVVPPPKLEEAVALADAHRPDLLSGQNAIAQANAAVELERRRAKPQVAIQPGWSYQDQRHIDGFRNGSMFDIGISTTLPFTDLNQGNIRKAQALMSAS